MTIEIQKPELEALIQERMRSGGFQDVEEVLIQALRSSPSPKRQSGRPLDRELRTMGTELVAAMQASPFKEICLSPDSAPMPVRDVGF